MIELTGPDIENLISGARVLLPELVLALTLFSILVQDLIRRSSGWSSGILMVGILISLVLLFTGEQPAQVWEAWFRSDPISGAVRYIIGVSGILTVWMNTRKRERPGEYYLLIAGIILGGFLAVSANHLLLIVIALELISIPSYLLAGFNFRKKSAEASIKYFLFGAAATAIMIYGISLLYGSTGFFSFTGQVALDSQRPAFSAGLLLTTVGLLFKLAAFPMHLWLPDVYEEAPMPVVALFSVVPKAAGLVVLARLAEWAAGAGAQDLMFMLLATVAIITMILGNTAALRQDNARRMLGFSSIAHGGFLLLGIVTFTSYGLSSMLFYLSVYMVMSYGVFSLVQYVERSTGTVSIRAMAGMGAWFPLAGVLLVIHLIALTGLPPTAGFTAKFVLFSSVYTSYSITGNMLYLVLFVIGILNAVISLFYYLKIPYNMFLKTAEISTLKTTGRGDLFLGLIMALMVLFLFFSPGLLIELFNNVNFAL